MFHAFYKTRQLVFYRAVTSPGRMGPVDALFYGGFILPPIKGLAESPLLLSYSRKVKQSGYGDAKPGRLEANDENDLIRSTIYNNQ